jgi:hypothetical protein
MAIEKYSLKTTNQNGKNLHQCSGYINENSNPTEPSMKPFGDSLHTNYLKRKIQEHSEELMALTGAEEITITVKGKRIGENIFKKGRDYLISGLEESLGA